MFKQKRFIIYIIFTIFLISCSSNAKISAKVMPKDSGSITGAGEYKVGSKVNLKARPKKNYQFIGWEKNNEIIEKEKSYDFIINSDEKLTAKFKKKEFKIDLKSNIEDGKTYGQGKYEAGEKQIISAEEVEGYNFSHWEDKNGKIISEKNEKMITLNKDISLVAIYEKIKPFLGYSKNDIKEKIYWLYNSSVQTVDGDYHTFTKVSDKYQKSFENGKFFITLKPDNLDINMNNNIEIKEIEIVDDIILAKFQIKMPKIRNKNKEILKSELKRKLPNINEFYSNYFNYNSNNYEIYEKEIKLKVIDDKLVVIDFDKFDYLFSEYQDIYKKIIVENINEITLEVANNSIKTTKVIYENKIYEGNFDSKIFNQKELYSKINFRFSDRTKLDFNKLYFPLKKKFNNHLVADHFLFNNISLIKDDQSDKIITVLTFLRGMSPTTILISKDQESSFKFSERIGYSIINDSIKCSDDRMFISYLFGYPKKGNLEILNLKNMKRIQIFDLIKDKTLYKKENAIFKNVKWQNENNIEFELYLKQDANEKLIKKGRFIYDIEKNKIKRVIEKLKDYESISIDSKTELISIINSSIKNVDEKIADIMISDIVNRVVDHSDFDNYFNDISQIELNNQINKSINKLKEKYPKKYNYKNKGIYDNKKKLVLKYIQNENVKEKMKKYFEDYYGFKLTDGGYSKEIDYIEIKNNYGKYLSKDFNKYLNLKINEILNPLGIDGVILLSPEELGKILINYEMFLKNSDNNKLKKDIKENYLNSLSPLLYPRRINSYLNKHYQATYDYRMVLDKLMKNNTIKVTSMAAKEMYDFVYSKNDFILRSDSDNSDLQ
ncbi:MAG: InlB B-repeat-containing protein, partial [Bacillota bacterium]